MPRPTPARATAVKAICCAFVAMLSAPAAALPVQVEGGPALSARPGAAGPAAWGRLVLPAKGWGLEATVREGVTGRSLEDPSGWTSSGALCFGARTGRGPWVVRGGFAHQHDIPVDLARAAPLQAALGTAPGITHRSGVELGAAVEGRLPRSAAWGWTLGVAGAWLTGPEGGGAAAWAEAGLRWAPAAGPGAPG